jgi:ribosomal protein S18 acetylase RimI-like enzyme
MIKIEIHAADDPEREQASLMLATSEPWITLGISQEQCRKNCYNPDFLVYIACSDRSPSGVIIIDPLGVAGSPYVKSVAVLSELRGQGIGASLISFAEDLFRGKARYIFLCVSSFNHRARKFYENLGYQISGEFKDYIIDGASEILMYKRI